MIEVHPGLFVGKVDEAIALPEQWKKVFAAQNFHYKLHGWKHGEKHQEHPCYVLYEEEQGLSLNWVDGPAKYFDYQGKGVEIMRRVLDWIEKHLPENNLIIACNQAVSRSPSIALVYLAKRAHTLPESSFAEASVGFLEIYPMYKPGDGIAAFLGEKWDKF